MYINLYLLQKVYKLKL